VPIIIRLINKTPHELPFDYESYGELAMRSRSACCGYSGNQSAWIVCNAVSLLTGLVFSITIAQVQAGELIYKPVNPNFGGNPFNDGILLGTANAQNGYTAKRRERDPTEQFVRSLQSRLYSGLANQVQEAIFGDDPQESGSFTVGDQQVSFERGLEMITLEISNLANGSSTVIEVPVIEVE
jgi:curli production assembly/transport component CsgF